MVVMNGGDDVCYNDAGGGCDVDDAGGDDVDGYDTDDDEYDDDDGGGDDDDDDNDNDAADDDDDGESHSLHWLSWTSKAHAVSLEVHCHLEMHVHPMHRALPQACPSPQP